MQLHRMLKGPNSLATVLVSPMRPALACRRREVVSRWLLLRAQRNTLHIKVAAMKQLIRQDLPCCSWLGRRSHVFLRCC